MRAKKKSAPRGSGGVSVFVKNDLIQTGRFRRVFENFDDCVILYFSCTDLCDISNDFVFVFTYVSPEYSPIYASSDDNGIELQEVIDHFQFISKCLYFSCWRSQCTN